MKSTVADRLRSALRRDDVLVLAAATPVLASMFAWTMSRGLTWDEAVYVGRATLSPNWRSMWGPSRMLGMPIVISPLTALTDNVVLLRAWLVTVGTLVSWTALRWWRRLVGPAIVASFVVVGLSWPAMWFSTSAYPNWLTALLVFALSGWTLCALRGESVSAVAGFAVAFMAFQMRWTDVALSWGPVVLVAMWVAAAGDIRERLRSVVSAAPSSLRRIAPALVGSIVSVLVWVVESEVYFGSVRERLRFVGAVSRWERFQLGQYGELLWFYREIPDGLTGANHLGLVFLVVTGTSYYLSLLVLGVAGLRVAGAERRRPLAAVFAGGASIATVYLVSPGDSLRRFILPGLVLMSAPVGFALARGWRAFRARERRGALGFVAVTGLLLAGVGGNVVFLGYLDSREGHDGEVLVSLGRRIEELSSGRECRFLSEFAYPQIQLETSCVGSRSKFDTEGSTPTSAMLGADVSFLAGPDDPAEGWLDAGWIRDGDFGEWTLWVRGIAP